NGPAVAIVHKSLSNTFTVPTTGLYYIAVRATGSSGTAPHLAWDDLRIEIPCDLNQPPLAIVASNNTVCAGQNVILTATGADVVTWSNNAGTGNVVTVNPLINTLYTAMGTSTLTGCGATASQYITVNPAPNVNVLATPPNICA